MVEDVVPEALGQRGAPVRFEWGPTGAAAVSDPEGCLVVVDVLSFTTAVSVVTGRGTAVYPYAMGDSGAQSFAAARGAELAVRRREATSERPWSLSPASLARAPLVPRLVLPSPNGSAIAAAAAGTVVAGCLRNASAVAAWLLEHGYGVAGRPVAVVAAGERWPDGSLRPALEDGLGAGAVLRRLRAAGLSLSAEAAVAAGTLDRTSEVAAAIRGCATALELASVGFPDDVELALGRDVDDHVPVLDGEAFRAEPARR
ncbi:MAG TPA: 2-phosphosulfolactate phosphatase [Acidimicrobiales bacterium]|nr:2-phosphosulfolactate phosphatase [Acidimicrobiales bacterium]